MKKFDCFACSGERGKCDILTLYDCTDCSFYKTKEQFDEDNLAALDMLLRKGRQPCEKTVTRFDEFCKKKEVRIMSVKPV